MSQKVLLTSKEVHIILHRLACQLIENHLDFSNTILIGLQPRGKFLAERIKQILESEYQVSNIQLGFWTLLSFVMILEEAKNHWKPTKPKSIF